MFSKESTVAVVQYDDKIKRKSLEEPLRNHRRSSIPFVDRKPAVRFIRSIQQGQASDAGPNSPSGYDRSKKPILKKNNFPILVSQNNGGLEKSIQGGSSLSTNDELENCKITADLIMDRISSAERIARGSMDVLTFPTATRRVEALSRYQGNMAIAVCTIYILTTSSFYIAAKKKGNVIAANFQKNILELALKMRNQGIKCQKTGKKFLTFSKRRYNVWESLLKRSSDFKIDQLRVKYPIYTQKRMPESVTMYEETSEDSQGGGFDGYVRICRTFPEEKISLHCDSSQQADMCQAIDFKENSLETQLEIIKLITSQGKELLVYSDNILSQGLEVLHDEEMDEASEAIRKKISSLEYDECFDPLSALELKNALGELVARKADLLNTAEQIVKHCKHIRSITKMFYRFIKRSVNGGPAGFWTDFGSCSCFERSSKKRLLQLLGLVSVDDITILLPLTLAIAKDIFHMDPAKSMDNQEESGKETTKKGSK